MKLLTEWTAKEKRFDSLVRDFAVSEGWGGRGGREGGREGGRGRRRGIEAVGGREEGWKEGEVEERWEEGKVKVGWSRLGSSGGRREGGEGSGQTDG